MQQANLSASKAVVIATVIWAFGALTSGMAFAQAPLQFTNTDLAVLEVLAAEGMEAGEQLTSSGQSLGNLIVDSHLSAQYPTSGEQRATVELDGGKDVYRFLGDAECVGVVEVAWATNAGTPVSVLGSQIVAGGSNGSDYVVQAVSTILEETHTERLAVRGGSDYTVAVDFALGADRFGNAITFSQEFDVAVACDAVVGLQIDIADATGIRGKLDVDRAATPDWNQMPVWGAGEDLLDSIMSDSAAPNGSTPDNPAGGSGAPGRPGLTSPPVGGGGTGGTGRGSNSPGIVAGKSIGSLPGQTSICSADDFADTVTGGVWSESFIGDADQGGVVETGGRLQVSGNGTTLFHDTDNTFFYSQSTTGDFRVEVDITGVPNDVGGGFRKAGLMVRDGDDDLDPRLYINFLPFNPFFAVPTILFDYRDENGLAEAWASQLLGVTLPVRVAIDRRGDLFSAYFSTDNGATWAVPSGGFNSIDGQVSIPMSSTVDVGLNVASYDAAETMTVEFDNFNLCNRNTDPLPPRPDPVTCQAGRVVDLVYMLDVSGSMTTPFPNASSKLDAGRQAIAAINDILQTSLPGSRAALVGFSGEVSNPAANLTDTFKVYSTMTSDLDSIDTAAAAIDESLIHPDTTTPLGIAFDEVREFILAEYDPVNLPVLLWITDGQPNVDLNGFGPLEYRFEEVNILDLRAGTSFRPWGAVAWDGNFNGALGTYDGEVLANAVFKIQQAKAAIQDLTIYSVAVQGDSVFKEDLLDFASWFTGGETVSVTDATSLVGDLSVIFDGLDCGAVIGDRVWNDANGDGVQDPGEVGLEGVDLQLLDSGGAVVATTTTGADGIYSFDVLPGTYTVEVVTSTLPAGLSGPTFDRDGTGTPHTAEVTVAAGDNIDDVDFGYEAILGSISGIVWHDADADTTNNGEDGLENVTVRLLDDSGIEVATMPTGPGGSYLFENVPAGNYSVVVDDSTLPTSIDIPTFDIDGIATPHTAVVSLAAGENRSEVDFGYTDPRGSIGDRVWDDANGDGAQDGGEGGLAGVTVRLLDAGGTEIDSDVTDGNGNYLFENLPAGDYTVVVDDSTLPAGFDQATYDLDGVGSLHTAAVTLADGEENLDVDFGYRPAPIVDPDFCPRGPNWWKNRVSEWPVATLEIGGVVYNQTELLSFLSYNGGDMSRKLLKHLVTAMLNVAAGAPVALVEDVIDAGSSWLAANPPGCAPRGALKRQAKALKNNLRDFNKVRCPKRKTFCVSEADSSAYNGSGGHALWMPGISNKLVFADSGQWRERRNGTATFEGTVHKQGDADKFFHVDVNLSGYTPFAPPGSPKKELSSNAYAPTGPIDTDDWYYYTEMTATLTGGGDWAGAIIELTRRGPAIQVGEGASGKNLENGAASWFDWQVLAQPTTGHSLQSTGHGDFNISFVCETVHCVQEAWGDAYSSSGNHAIAMPGIAQDLLVVNSGSLIEFEDGTARLELVVRHKNHSDRIFEVLVELSGRTDVAPPGSPKKELPSNAYVPVGPADPSTWYYYTHFEATFTGRGFWEGAVVEATQRGPAWQIGVGASNKNVDFGASAWFDYDVTHQPTTGCQNLNPWGHGDFNLNLTCE